MSAAPNIETANERATTAHDKSVLWLGTGEPPLPLVAHLRSRGLTLVATKGAVPPIARVMIVEPAASPAAARTANVKGRRVAVMHPDPGSADALAQALRSRGAEVVALSLDPSALHRVEGHDPDAVVMEVSDFYGSCWEIVRALWQHPRLRYAPILLSSPEGSASYTQGTLDVPSLCLAVQQVSESYAALREASANGSECKAELRTLGPARILRALTESQRAFRVHITCPMTTFDIDIAEGIIVGAQARALNAENDSYLGVHALSLLMQQANGEAVARSADHPAVTNVMAPLDTALYAAREAPQKLAADEASVPAESAAKPAPVAAGQPPASQPQAEAPAPQVKAPQAQPEPAEKPHMSALLAEPRRTIKGLPPPRSAVVESRRLKSVAPAHPDDEPTTLPAPAPKERETAPALPPSTARLWSGAAASEDAAPAVVMEMETKTVEFPAQPLLESSLFDSTDTAESSAAGPEVAPQRTLEADAGAMASETRNSSLVAARNEAQAPLVARALALGAEVSAKAREALVVLNARLPQQPKQRLVLFAAAGGSALLLALGLALMGGTRHETPKPPPLAAAAPQHVQPGTGPARVAGPAPTETLAAAQPEKLATTPAEAGELDDDDNEELGAQSDRRKASHLVSQGHSFRKRKLYPSAKARYQEALDLLPNYPRALVGLAQVASAQGQHRDAIALAQKLLQLRPTSSTYQVLLGDVYSAANMPRDAQAAYERAARSGSSTAKQRLKSQR